MCEAAQEKPGLLRRCKTPANASGTKCSLIDEEAQLLVVASLSHPHVTTLIAENIDHTMSAFLLGSISCMLADNCRELWPM